MKTFPDGVWPVMLTPFQENGALDWEGLHGLIEWYIKQGCDGLFAVCQSSEMFFLDLEERTRLAKETVRASGGRLPVLVSGHISESLTEQAKEIARMADTGADAVVLVANRLVSNPTDDDRLFIHNLRRLLSQIPRDIPLGFYECPYPFKRLLTSDILRFCLDSGRFCFIKDTSCDLESIKEKLAVLRGSEIKLFNANTATLLDSLKCGANGYTGVMANFHPALYKWLNDHWMEDERRCGELQEVLTMCALIELKKYPACAKRFLREYQSVPILDVTRKDAERPEFGYAEDAELSQIDSLTHRWLDRL